MLKWFMGAAFGTLFVAPFVAGASVVESAQSLVNKINPTRSANVYMNKVRDEEIKRIDQRHADFIAWEGGEACRTDRTKAEQFARETNTHLPSVDCAPRLSSAARSLPLTN